VRFFVAKVQNFLLYILFKDILAAQPWLVVKAVNHHHEFQMWYIWVIGCFQKVVFRMPNHYNCPPESFAFCQLQSLPCFNASIWADRLDPCGMGLSHSCLCSTHGRTPSLTRQQVWRIWLAGVTSWRHVQRDLRCVLWQWWWPVTGRSFKLLLLPFHCKNSTLLWQCKTSRDVF